MELERGFAPGTRRPLIVNLSPLRRVGCGLKIYGSSGNFGNCFERPEHFPKRRLSRQKSL